jgi:hypothetical protein
MRNALLAGATLIVGTVTLAHAQAPVANPSQGQMAAPYGAGPASNNNNNAWGIANTPSGGASAGPLSTVYAPNVDAVPVPGTIVIRLNGRIEADVTANFTPVDKGRTQSTTGGAPLNGYKLNPVGIGTNFRLYPGFDGLAANGLRYGAVAELRENFAAGTTTASGTGAATGPSGNTSAETVYVRRAFTYLAADQAGIVRLGQTDGVLGLFDNCIFVSACWDAGSSVFNGGGSQLTSPSGVVPPFVWLSGNGAEYGNNKIVYLTPQFYGVDFGVQYAPNEGNAYSNASGASPTQSTTCAQGAANCISVSSGNDPTRWINQVGAGLRFQWNFGVVDFKTYGFYETAGKEDLTTTGYSTLAAARTGAAAGSAAYPNGTTAASATTLHYDNLSFYKAGVAVTAFNFTAALDYIGGAVNGALAERPTGGVGTNALLTGLTYAAGPIGLGVAFGVIDTQGDARLTGIAQRHEFEIAFGGNYKLAPGVQLVAEYQYAHRHQGGYDFTTGGLGQPGAASTAGTSTRDAQYQGLTFATVLTW